MTDFDDLLAVDFSVFTSDLSVSLTYQRRSSSTVNTGTGVETPVYVGKPLTVVRQGLSSRVIAMSNGLYQHGDVIFFVKASQLGAKPARVDRIAYGDDTYEVRDWELEEDENVYRILARRL